MRRLTALLGAITLTALSLVGCNNYPPENTLKRSVKAEEVNYFGRIPLESRGSMFMAPGDFNEDGHLDIVVGAENPFTEEASLYFFEGDGKGNFKSRFYSK